jgi:hypothetical protein
MIAMNESAASQFVPAFIKIFFIEVFRIKIIFAWCRRMDIEEFGSSELLMEKPALNHCSPHFSHGK